MTESYRTERDSMGEMKVPADAYWGAQTQRAMENFPISGLSLPNSLIRAMGLIKQAAAQINGELGLLDSERGNVISRAAAEVAEGHLDAQFVLDIFQTGSGTSSNMNANEVIARRAWELASMRLAIHPNDHVNMCQSSNDVIPSAIHLAAAKQCHEELLPALAVLEKALGEKVLAFDGLVKSGRTHLQDATPIRLGQEFSGYKAQLTHSRKRIEKALDSIYELPLGGTAVGTGINTHPEFAKRVIALLAKLSGLPLREAENHFEAQGAKDGIVELSGQLKTVAGSLFKIANDIRWLGSGPRCGLGELVLPEVQPGSSIMPGKVNPVIAESLLMVCVQVIGNDNTIIIANQCGSSFELNVMMPVMAHNLLQSIALLARGSKNFAQKCVVGIKANEKRLQELLEANISTCTALAPLIGYDRAAEIAKEAFKSGLSIREIALQKKVLPPEELDKALNPLSMTRPAA